MSKGRLAATRRRLYATLEQDSATGRLSLVVNYGLIALIVLTLIATVLESIPALNDAYRSSFYLIELVAVSVFSVEYAARAWTAYEHAPWHRFGPVGSRLRYLGSAWGLIDLVGILPVWLAIFMAPELKTLLVLRLLRFLKLTRYSPAMRSLLDALYAERRALAGCFVILVGTPIGRVLAGARLRDWRKRISQKGRHVARFFKHRLCRGEDQAAFPVQSAWRAVTSIRRIASRRKTSIVPTF